MLKQRVSAAFDLNNTHFDDSVLYNYAALVGREFAAFHPPSNKVPI